MASPSAASGKAEIRALALQRREALAPGQRRDFGRTIWDRILATVEFRDARTVLAYSSFGSEIDTTALLIAILEAGKTLLLPTVNRSADRLEVYRVTNLDADLRVGVFGIREPDPEICAPGSVPDLAIVPGVAFDRNGGRIGYGKGYYDKLLAANRPRTISAAFEVQVVDAVPMETHDVPVDMLVTEAGEWSGAAL